METLFIYLLKTSVLIAVYFLAYHFLLRKETFFTTNRWFLLAGLLTSTILPLLFIKKYIIVEKPEFTPEQLIALEKIQTSTAAITSQTTETSINWANLIVLLYLVTAVILFLKILGNSLSLFKLLHKKQVVKHDQFALVDVKENIQPFSFFNYIVFNSNQYTNEELHSILLHEKVHSQEKHSIDVLIARLFCIAFWFNPFMWWYKKAILQNLEYIADSKASRLIEDKKVYQKALLKVVTHQNCLAITNHFYQSLIKNRIVMLNKNESQKRNSWKYAMILPALTVFILAFQVKTIAQERVTKIEHKVQEGLHLAIDKNSSDEEMKNDAKMAKEKFGVTLKYSKIKRNSKGEITGIKVEFKDQNGKTGITHIQSEDPIKPIYFHKTDDNIGFGRAKHMRIPSHKDEKTFSYSFFGEDDDDDKLVDIERIAPEAIDAPDTPEMPEGIEAPNAPDAPKSPIVKNFRKSIIINKSNDGKPEIIINGKKLDIDSDEYKKMAEDFNGKLELKMDENGPMVFKFNDDEIFKFNGADIEKFTREAMKNSHIQIEKMREKLDKMRPDMEKMKIQMEKVKPEDFDFNFKWDDKDNPDVDMKKAREEMLKAKDEMQKARDEMIKAREEMQKAKSELKTRKA